jgi:hypothetical protein
MLLYLYTCGRDLALTLNIRKRHFWKTFLRHTEHFQKPLLIGQTSTLGHND